MTSTEELARALPQHKYDNPAYDDHTYCLAQAEKILSNLRRIEHDDDGWGVSVVKESPRPDRLMSSVGQRVDPLLRREETPMDERVDPDELRERLRRGSIADEQIDALDHVLAALTIDDLTWDQIDKLGEVAGRAIDLWAAALKAGVRGGR